jgi:photosystem II stability/assembly factor-like uncharacterized protein
MKNLASFHLSMILLLAGLAGCGGKAAPPEDTPATETTPADAVPSATPAPAQEDGPWKVVRKIDPISFAATVVGFFDESLGYTAGYGGEVHFTTDGGKTWPAGVNASMCRFGMDILDAQTAWTIGNGGNVRVTNDSGQTWTPLADVPIGLSQFISMADGTAGWAATSIQLVATGDGGQTWTNVALPHGVRGIAALSLRTAEEGYFVDNGGDLYVTRDGGQTWAAKPLGVEKPVFTPKSLAMGAVRFTDSGHGVVIVNLEENGGELTVLRTADGGDTWTREVLPEKAGVLFLTRDADLLTVFSMDNRITLLRYQADGG